MLLPHSGGPAAKASRIVPCHFHPSPRDGPKCCPYRVGIRSHGPSFTCQSCDERFQCASPPRKRRSQPGKLRAGGGSPLARPARPSPRAFMPWGGGLPRARGTVRAVTQTIKPHHPLYQPRASRAAGAARRPQGASSGKESCLYDIRSGLQGEDH